MNENNDMISMSRLLNSYPLLMSIFGLFASLQKDDQQIRINNNNNHCINLDGRCHRIRKERNAAQKVPIKLSRR